MADRTLFSHLQDRGPRPGRLRDSGEDRKLWPLPASRSVENEGSQSNYLAASSIRRFPISS